MADLPASPETHVIPDGFAVYENMKKLVVDIHTVDKKWTEKRLLFGNVPQLM